MLHQGWWKFDEYDLVPSWETPTHVVPARGSKLVEYEAFDRYEDFWGGRGRIAGAPPYMQLANLDLEDPGEVVRWCSRYGLLGILLQQTLEVRFWPRWEPLGWMDEALPDGEIAPRQSWYDRVGGAWRESITQPSVVTDSCDSIQQIEYMESAQHRTEGDALNVSDFESIRSSSQDAGRTLLPVGVRGQNLSGRPVEEGLVEGWAQFFPYRCGVSAWVRHRMTNPLAGVVASPHLASPDYWSARVPDHAAAAKIERRLERRPYPMPCTEEFCREYGEPLDLFRRYAGQVRRTVAMWQSISSLTSRREVEGVSSDYSTGSWGVEFNRFQVALQTVHPVAALELKEQARWSPRWLYPSLYAALHLMMYQDFPLGGRLVKQCQKDGCPKRFATDRAWHKYCSPQCKWAARKRRQRGT